MATFINPALIADSVAKPQPVIGPIALAEGVNRVQQLQQANQQQQAMAPLQQGQAAASLQGTQLENQQKQQSLQDQQAFAAAMRDSGGDPVKLRALAAQTISDPWMLSRVENTAAQISQRDAATTAAQDKQTADMHELYSGQLQSVADADGKPEQATMWKDLATRAMAQKDPSGQNTFPQGVINPDVVPDAATIKNIITYLNGSTSYFQKIAKGKESDALAAQKATQAQVGARQAEREDIADQYQSVSNPEEHQQFLDWVQKEHPKVASSYANLPFDPDNTPSLIENLALSAQQRSANAIKQQTADAAMARASVAGGRAGLFARANDPSLSDADRKQYQDALDAYDKKSAAGGLTPNAQLIQQRYLQKRSDADSKEHTLLQGQEQDQWALQGRYGDVLKQAGVSAGTTDQGQLGQTVKDPKTGRDITAGEALQLMQAARSKAVNLADQQKEIRKRQQWGEFAPPASAAPAAPSSNGGAPPSGGTTQTSKTFPRSQLHAFAQRNEITDQQAEDGLKSRGYIVNQ